MKMFRFCSRLPDFGGEVQPAEAKYDGTQRFVDFNENFTVATKAFEEYDIWNRLFPFES